MAARPRREFKQIVAIRHNKKWTVAFGCYWAAMFALIASACVRAEICSGHNCKLASGPFEYSAITRFGLIFTTIGPFISTSDKIDDGRSKHYVQAVKDDAAYLATDGDLDGSMLESAWRAYLHKHADFQPNKKEFAHLVLATYG
ncbi:DUF2388 domain-containing protein [Pseudomonas sp. ANT_H12B]|nr:DUF2388 domain-containing protein [Pseudomonas sp. ANT_H12B]